MGFEYFSTKQHINLSNEAWSCIYSDKELFSPEGKSRSLDWLLNTIIENYWAEADATITEKLKRSCNTYEELLKRLGYKENEQKTLLSAYRYIEKTKLVENIAKKQFGTSRKFNLYDKGEHNVFEILTRTCNEEKYYKKQGDYLRALFEEYASLSLSQRERIIFKPRIRDIEEAINCSKLIAVSTGGKTYRFVPYRLVDDPVNGYNYLVGVSVGENDDLASGKNVSFRLSRIDSVRDLLDIRRLTSEQKQQLDKDIIEKRPGFVYGDLIDIEVLMTPRGFRLYSTLASNRPIYSEIKEEGEYKRCYFRCTERQAKAYFVRLGSDAIVVSPPSLNKSIRKYFQKSAKDYSSFGSK